MASVGRQPHHKEWNRGAVLLTKIFAVFPSDNLILQNLRSSGNRKELEARMLPRISFGTAGLRAKMQAGFAFMNDLIVQQTSQAMIFVYSISSYTFRLLSFLGAVLVSRTSAGRKWSCVKGVSCRFWWPTQFAKVCLHNRASFSISGRKWMLLPESVI